MASEQLTVHYPRVCIEFCTKCRWNLRAAWYAQELLSTFGNQLGEVSMAPADAGTFRVVLTMAPGRSSTVWDRKVQNGFPDAKELKQRVRDVIDPAKSLGHSDKPGGLQGQVNTQEQPASAAANDQEVCVDCNEK